MNKKVIKTVPDKNEQIEIGIGLKEVSRIFILTIGITGILLLFPSHGNLTVFAKGEFAYLESIGIIFVCLALFSVCLFIIPKAFLKMRAMNRLFRDVFFVGSIGVSILFMLTVITFTWIRFDVKTHCDNAKKEYGGNYTEALSRQLEDTNQGFGSKNSAIWALGQLADKNSLPILRKYYTGKIPKREPLNETITNMNSRRQSDGVKRGILRSGCIVGFRMIYRYRLTIDNRNKKSGYLSI